MPEDVHSSIFGATKIESLVHSAILCNASCCKKSTIDENYLPLSAGLTTGMNQSYEQK